MRIWYHSPSLHKLSLAENSYQVGMSNPPDHIPQNRIQSMLPLASVCCPSHRPTYHECLLGCPTFQSPLHCPDSNQICPAGADQTSGRKHQFSNYSPRNHQIYAFQSHQLTRVNESSVYHCFHYLPSNTGEWRDIKTDNYTT